MGKLKNQDLKRWRAEEMEKGRNQKINEWSNRRINRSIVCTDQEVKKEGTNKKKNGTSRNQEIKKQINQKKSKNQNRSK